MRYMRVKLHNVDDILLLQHGCKVPKKYLQTVTPVFSSPSLKLYVLS